jgi:hypothetical protein
MSRSQELAHILRELADRLDPYRPPPRVLPEPGDPISVKILGNHDWTCQVRGVVEEVQGSADGRGISWLVVRETS